MANSWYVVRFNQRALKIRVHSLFGPKFPVDFVHFD